MNILEKNVEEYRINFTNSYYRIGDLLNSGETELISEPDYTINRTLFLAYELTNIEQILNILNNLNEKSILFLYYRDERYLYELLSKVDFTEKEYRAVFFAGSYKDADKINKLDELLKGFLYTFSSIQPIVRMSGDLDYIRSAKEFLSFIGNLRDNYLFLLGNDMNDTLCGLRNRLCNLSAYVHSVGLKEFQNKFKEIYRNKPAVIVSSGPSLDKNIQYLKEYQDKALILSCDGSLATLERHGIKAHVVGSVERGYRTYEVFYKDKEIDQQIVFSGPAVVRPEILDKFHRENILGVFKDKDIYGKWMNEITLDKKGVIWAGSSVAHYLTSLAEQLGCNPIILVGQDLAYSIDGVSHAGEVVIKEKVDVNKATEWVKDYNGNDIPSTYVWKKFLIQFEDIVRLSDKTIIDATEGGALIKGTQIRIFKEALDEYCTSKIPVFKKLLNEITVEEEYVVQAKQSSYQGIMEMINTFELLLDSVKIGIDRNKCAIESLSQGLETQEQLDLIYDALDFVDENVVKYIAKSTFTMMLFQYPIYSASRAINALGTSEFTHESIQFNLALHKDLLMQFDLYTGKMIRVLIKGLRDNSSFFDSIVEYKQCTMDLENKFFYLLENDEYDIKLI